MTASSFTHPVVRHRLQLDRRSLLVGGGLLLALLVALALSLLLGDYILAPDAVLRSLLSPLTGVATPGADFIVLGVRLPRALLALLSGAAFGLSGAIFQMLLRNPLASPDIIGISSGASAAAVFCIIVLGWGGLALSLGALAGALLTALAIYLLAWRDGLSPFRVVLVGIAVAAMLVAVISYLFTRARIFEVQQAMGWLVGSLNGAAYGRIAPLGLTMLVLVPLALLLGRALALLPLGDDAAKGLGLPVEPVRVGLLAVAVALCAFATAAVGPVSFVAFVAGPIARRLLGTGRVGLVPAALVGALVMLGADLIAQHGLPNTQLPVGVVTGLFGAGFLIWLLVDAGRTGRAA